MEYKCGVCGQHVENDLLIYIDHTEAHIVDEIRAVHPTWAGKDGLCKKCIEYYRNEMKGKSSKEE